MSIEAPKVHVHMTVSNLEKSRAFYEKFFGTAPVKVKPGYVKFLPPFGPLNLALAEASCTQMLGDRGADVIKVERPGVGDETRTWGPPFLRDARGVETAESGYYLSANRNKRSITINFAKPEGAALVRRLLTRADVLIENFKVGGLAEYGLAYDQLCAEYPRLVYCSITGYGQDGPYAARPGYDLMAQGAGGIMSVTGEADGTARQGRRRRQRRHEWPVRGGRDPRRAPAPRSHRPRPAHRHRAAGRAGGLALQCRPEPPALGGGAAALGHGAPQHRAVPGVPDERWPRDPRREQRRAVPPALRVCRRAGARGRSALRHQRAPSAAPRRAGRHRLRAHAQADDAALGGRPRGGRASVRPRQHHRPRLRRFPGAASRDEDRDGAPGRRGPAHRQPAEAVGHAGELPAPAADAGRAHRRGPRAAPRPRRGRAPR